ncbi:MAG TPA: hypothetical protein VF143_07335 [Candidatus Nanopelagicales bacterium]
MTSRIHRRGVAALTSAVALLALTAGTTSARTIDAGQELLDETFAFQACGGVNITLRVVGAAAWVDRLRGGDLDAFEYLTPWFTRNVQETTETITNLDTDKSFTNVVRRTSWDQQVLAVEGTTATYRRFGTFRRTLFSGGERQYVSVGKFSYDYVYDTLGTPDPADDVDTIVDGSGRTVGNGRDDFCADVADYTS